MNLLYFVAFVFLCSLPGPQLLNASPKVRILFATRIQEKTNVSGKFYSKTAKNLSRKMFLHQVLVDGKKSPWLWLSRNLLTASHPEAGLSQKTPETKAGPEAGSMIIPVQEYLEKNALEEAIILDCKPEGKLLAGCGIYLYERAQGRVTASTTRHFSVNIKDPSSWSSPMVSHFVKGLNTLEEREIKKALKKLTVIQPPEPHFEAESLAGLTGSIRFDGSGPLVPAGGVQFLTGHKARKWALEMSGYRTSSSTGEQHQQESGIFLGTGITGSSEEIHGLIWDLGVLAGLWHTQKHSEAGRARQRAVQLKFFPALRIPLTPFQQISVRYESGWESRIHYQGSENFLPEPGRFHALMISYLLVI